MSLSPSQPRTVTELDHVRISNLLRRQPAPGGAASATQVLLDNADLVPSQDIAPDVVTMYTRVRVADPQTGVQRELTVCYPPDADVGTGFVSVLSPVGAALLGVGPSHRWWRVELPLVRRSVAAGAGLALRSAESGVLSIWRDNV